MRKESIFLGGGGEYALWNKHHVRNADSFIIRPLKSGSQSLLGRELSSICKVHLLILSASLKKECCCVEMGKKEGRLKSRSLSSGMFLLCSCFHFQRGKKEEEEEEGENEKQFINDCG